MRRIILDLSMAQSGGGFTYAVNVIPLLAARMPETEFLVVLRSKRIAGSLPGVGNIKLHLMPDSGFGGRLLFLVLHASALAKSWDADLYYSASELSPRSCPCPKVAAFRNANLFTDLRLGWPLYQQARIWMLRTLARYSARTCSRILFVSEHSAQWIGDSLGLSSEKRVVVPHGVNEGLWSGPKGSRPFDREYILSVSSIYRYKNFVRLIEAWTKLAVRLPDVPDLVIVGDDQDPLHSREMHEAQLRAGNLADRIHLVGEVPYAEIARYYRNAKAFVFPSYLETFGHPLLEAMAAGIPVVASDLGVFREVGAGAALYFSAHDTDSIADTLERLLRDPDMQNELVARGFARVREYSWERAVDRMVSMFHQVHARP